MREIYDFYREMGWNYQQYIACLDPLGETRGESEFALEPAMYGKFLTELFDLWYADWKKGRQPYIRQFENYVGILLGYPPEACDQRGVCGITNVVEADGSVYPCDFYTLDEYRCGNAAQQPVEEIGASEGMRRFLRGETPVGELCPSCEVRGLCGGGCRRYRSLYTQESGYCPQQDFLYDALPQLLEIARQGAHTV